MLCQSCNTNQSDYNFFVNYGGHVGEVHLCAECAHQMGRQMHTMLEAFYQHVKPWIDESNGTPERGQAPSFAGFGYSGAAPEAAPDASPLFDAGEELRARRKLGELRAQLHRALSREDYEQAAKLRDEIGSAEKKQADSRPT